jgi:hypothetical protein
MSEIKIYFHAGHLGGGCGDLLSTFLAALALKHSKCGEWADKYGTLHDDDVWMMHPYCWCEEDSCGWCSNEKPNFLHKPSGFSVTWYKYIGRGMKVKGTPTEAMAALVGTADVAKLYETIDAAHKAFEKMIREFSQLGDTQ